MVDLKRIKTNVKPTYLNEKPNGKLRVSLDPRPLNKAVEKEHRNGLQEYIFLEISGAKYFSKLDVS